MSAKTCMVNLRMLLLMVCISLCFKFLFRQYNTDIIQIAGKLAVNENSFHQYALVTILCIVFIMVIHC